MKRLIYGLVLTALVGGAFVAGSRHGSRKALAGKTSPGRVVLYYVDPMNPAHTSMEPGLAPCGMKMEPVYADETGRSELQSSGSPMPSPGTVSLSLAKQQLGGLQTASVKRTAVEHTLRLLGKVAVDETRIYRILAPVDGRITKALDYAPGSVVKKHDTLAAYYSPEFVRAGQALLFAMKAKDRVKSLPQYMPAQTNAASELSDPNLPNGNNAIPLPALDYTGQFSQYDVTVKQNIDALKNFGMGEAQLEQLSRSRTPLADIDLTAPADGFVLARNVSLGQNVEKGAELFRLADLSRVWILADLFENDAEYVQPGATVQVSATHQNKTMTATVSQVLPQFDSASRALKVRLEVENTEFCLRPDMFVDVEVPLQLPPAILVPAQAVLDSGQSHTIYVGHGEGVFEPRSVKTGRHWGDNVEIVQGLEPGDQIVVAGNFMLDSESRLRVAAAALSGAPVRDPICGMKVHEPDARAANCSSEYQGRTYYFCSEQCKRNFEKDPAGTLQSPDQRHAESAAVLRPVLHKESYR